MPRSLGASRAAGVNPWVVTRVDRRDQPAHPPAVRRASTCLSRTLGSVGRVPRKVKKLVFNQLSDLAKGVIFYSIVLVLTVGLTFVPLDGGTMTTGAMFIPAFVVLLMLLVVTRDGRSLSGWASLGLHRPGLKGWPIAVAAAGRRRRIGRAQARAQRRRGSGQLPGVRL